MTESDENRTDDDFLDGTPDDDDPLNGSLTIVQGSVTGDSHIGYPIQKVLLSVSQPIDDGCTGTFRYQCVVPGLEPSVFCR